MLSSSNKNQSTCEALKSMMSKMPGMMSKMSDGPEKKKLVEATRNAAAVLL
ncbi:hypothetical protein DY000_02056640 [Brassica cretica]|uniref:TFIIS N-terminal domain-containing protein n=1 Tax=Brassica cretica TaxID=69181 RepID=A0ABQ7A517_BRACR|nr:hypothetical protein DY000_02056640 [Brassica cretica]